jgi:membrane-associated phospholipid phosphatase
MTSSGAWSSAGAVLFILLGSFAMNGYAQTRDDAAQPGVVSDDQTEGSLPPDSPGDGSTSLGVPLVRNLLSDQKAIWTSPFHLRWSDTNWLIPLAGASAVFFATDRSAMKGISSNPASMKRYVNVSNYGLAALAGVDGGMYVWGKFTHDDHATETGILAGEAALDSVGVNTVLKYSFGRERPYQNPNMPFFSGGTAFASDHSVVAWSVAGVIAHEYPGPLTQIMAYGLASAISASRVLGRQHSPSDVFVGAAIGWLIGQHVYRAHHDTELGGDSWESLSERAAESDRSSSSKGSPYVPLDSWIYPALDRLIGLGYIQTAFTDSKPWTRSECVQFVEEAGGKLGEGRPTSEEAKRIYDSLSAEFAPDLGILSGDRNHEVRLESLYTRVTEISGPPLRDSYDFGQTIINDYGRPYTQGFNDIAGFSGYATSGRFAIYLSGEYQHSPSAAAYSQSVQNFIAQVDNLPAQPAQASPAVNQFALLDAYGLANLDHWVLSFGKQSLWWGPAEGGAFLLTDNAPPFLMVRARQDVPVELPSFLRRLGPVKFDFFFGRLDGNFYPARPFLHGQKITLQRTKYLELSFSTMAEFGGVGRPITLGSILNSYISTGSSDSYQASNNPGKREFAFDFSYKIPGLRDWLTFYADSLLPEDNPTQAGPNAHPVDVNPNPIYVPGRAALRPGLFLSHVPGIPKLDLRVEAVYTNPPTPRSILGQYVYYNDYYHQLGTDDNFLIGDWIGREAMGFQGWTTYWFSPRTNLQFEYRHAKVASDFIPQGETINDGSSKLNWQVRDDFTVTASVQYEKWLAPILASTAQSNWTSSIGVTFWPRWGTH